MKKVRFQAHRGVCSEFPENTLIAYQAAVDQGYDIIEMDCKFTKDDVCIMFHDKTVNRTARLNGESFGPDPIPVGKFSYAQFLEMDLGVWKGEQFRGEKVITLTQALEFVAGQSIACKIDNVWETFPPHQRKILLDICQKANLSERLGITCARLETLKEALEALPEAQVHWDGDNDTATLDAVSALVRGRKLTVWVCYDNPISAWFKGRRATREICDQVRAYGEVGLWLLVEHSEGIRAIEEFGADVIETNGQLKPIR